VVLAARLPRIPDDEQSPGRAEGYVVVLRPAGFDWRAAGMSSSCTWDTLDAYAGLDGETRDRERKAQETRRRLGWECPGGTRRI
jgi:hypothetical protein